MDILHVVINYSVVDVEGGAMCERQAAFSRSNAECMAGPQLDLESRVSDQINVKVATRNCLQAWKQSQVSPAAGRMCTQCSMLGDT